MSRRRYRRYSNDLVDFIYGMGVLFYWVLVFWTVVIIAIIRVLMFFISMILFYTSKYKKKTGIGFFKTIFNKGHYGEYLLYRKIKKVIDIDNIFLNTYLPSEARDIENTEIDIIALSSKNIYCFEMKNYKGKIFGFREEYRWTQVLKNRKEYIFYNPLRQNEGHVKALETNLNVDRNLIVPIVVFSNKADISSVTTGGVIKLKEVKNYLMECELRSYDRFGEAQLEKYRTKLNECTDVSSDTIRNHIADVRELKYK